MKIEEFIEAIDKLQKFYDKDMNEEEKKIWFENFKTMDIKRFKYLISEIYKKNKFMPKLADMIETNKTIGYDEKYLDKQEKGIKDCCKCGNTGYIIYKKKVYDSLYDYIAVCSCGRQKPYKGERYYIPLAEQIGM